LARSTQQKIIRSAAEVFARNGVAETNMREVAERAELSLPVIYHHFGSKERLYQAVCTSVFGKKSQRLIATLKERDRSDKDRLLAYMIVLATDLSEDRIFFNLLHREYLGRDIAGQEKVSRESFGPPFTECVEICKRLAPERHSVFLCVSLHGLLLGTADVIRFGIYLNPLLRALKDPSTLAKHVLTTLLPELNWGRIDIEAHPVGKAASVTAKRRARLR
ncbi:MAG: TetR/AcrR family transcriptional regulator, partial [Steroidobacteraceae bacterium]